MQKCQITNRAGLQDLFHAMIVQAVRDAARPGRAGYEARHWLEFTAIPYLEDAGADTSQLYKHIIKPKRVRLSLSPIDSVYGKENTCK